MTYEVFGDNGDPTGFEEAIEAGWIDPADLSKALRDVMEERDRQRSPAGENYSLDHDDRHDKGELARAGAAYAISASARTLGHLDQVRALWPFDWDSFKGANDRRELVKGCALLLAEIERLDRAAWREGRR